MCTMTWHLCGRVPHEQVSPSRRHVVGQQHCSRMSYCQAMSVLVAAVQTIPRDNTSMPSEVSAPATPTLGQHVDLVVACAMHSETLPRLAMVRNTKRLKTAGGTKQLTKRLFGMCTLKLDRPNEEMMQPSWSMPCRRCLEQIVPRL